MGPFCPLVKLQLGDCTDRDLVFKKKKKKRNFWIFFKVLKHNMCIICPIKTDTKKLVKEKSTRVL